MKKLVKGGAVILITVVVGVVIFWFANDVGLQSIMFAILVNWFLMFWTSVIHRIIPISLPANYYQVQSSEQRLFNWLGVQYFQRILRKINLFNRELNLRDGRFHLPHLKQATQDAESAHFLIFMIVMALTGYALYRAWWLGVMWLFLFNMLFNGYPVLVQRYNRQRIERILKRTRSNTDLAHNSVVGLGFARNKRINDGEGVI